MYELKRKSFCASFGRAGRRFTHPDHPGIVFALMDRNVLFDGETRTAYVQGVNIVTPGGEWQRFNEEGLEYV